MPPLTPEQRRKNMQANTAAGTQIERLLADKLREKGYEFELNVADVVGKPDILFRQHKLAVFCDGEFWHGRDWLTHKNAHKTNHDFWVNKIENNIRRDQRVNESLAAAGYKVLRFWESEIKKNCDICLQIIENSLSQTAIEYVIPEHESVAAELETAISLMSEQLSFTPNASREQIYEEILPQIKAVIEGETDLVANMANVAAILKEALGFFWVGFYRNSKGELILAPFQGPLACTRIAVGKGVCGAAALQQKTIIVPDVSQFPGHIACSSLSQSEIVVPFSRNGETFFVLDVDSDKLDDFSEIDARYLEKVVHLLGKTYNSL